MGCRYRSAGIIPITFWHVRRITLRNHQSPGDLIVLSAALRDLHQIHPGQFQMALDSSCPAVWENNPYVVPIEDGMEIVEAHYPSVLTCGATGLHFIEGWRKDLGDTLGVPIHAGPLRPDLHLNREEREPTNLFVRDDRPVWLINAGYKLDISCKAWSFARWQQVVDTLPDIHWVQVGSMEHEHPRLSGVTQLIGQTDLRQLIVLCSQVDGILCGVTATMHLAAAFQKKCVVVAGAREPRSWEAYPGHTYLSNNEQFDCCEKTWAWRVEPLGDDYRDTTGRLADSRLCTQPATVEHGQRLAGCMAALTVEQVVEAVEHLTK